MRRLTLLSNRVLPAALVFTMFAGPALAQPTPQPARANTVRPVALPPGDLLQPTGQPNAVAPTPAPPGQDQQPGQATRPPAAAPRPEAPRAPSIASQTNQPMPSATNIRLDLAITDTYTSVPVKKTVSLLVLTGNSGMIRTSGSDGWSVLNIDAIAAAYTSGQVSLRMTFEYAPAQSKDSGGGRAPRLNESITVVLQDGKPLMVSQSADPATDRKVTAELTATILK